MALLKEGKSFNHKALPFSIEILKYYENSKPIRRSQPKSELYHGMAKNFLLIEIDNEKEAEANRPGIIFKVENSNSNADGIYSLILGQSIPQTFDIENSNFTVKLRRERMYLPFEIELIDFVRIIHPGTSIPKSFSSEVNLIENMFPTCLIQMNEPLRHKEFTFFQASFSQTLEGETSVLAVVQNYGRLFLIFFNYSLDYSSTFLYNNKLIKSRGIK